MNDPADVPAPEVRYKVGEVCRLADVQPYVLRYWESEFPVFAEAKNATGPRTYSARELQVIQRIKKLLYDEGYTIAGAKKRLEVETRAEDPVGAGDAERPAEPVSESAPPPRPRRARAKAPPVDSEETSGELIPSIFDEERPAVSNAARPEVALLSDRDPRVARVVSELKEIVELLSRGEP